MILNFPISQMGFLLMQISGKEGEQTIAQSKRKQRFTMHHVPALCSCARSVGHRPYPSGNFPLPPTFYLESQSIKGYFVLLVRGDLQMFCNSKANYLSSSLDLSP